MAKLQRLLRRRPEIDEAEVELVRSRTLARLNALGGGDTSAEGAADSPDQDNTEAAAGAALADESPAGTGDAIAAGAGTGDQADSPGRMPVIELPANAVGVMADDRLADGEGEGRGLPAAASGSDPEDDATDVAVMADAADRPDDWATLTLVPDLHEDSPSDADATRPSRRTGATPGRGAPKRHPAKGGRTATARVAHAQPRPQTRLKAVPAPAPEPAPASASCPYCALLLQPPPESTRLCPRCRQRIIVKHIQGRSVYLTEASLAVFDAERQRISNSGRWTKDRERWLKLADGVGAAPARVTRLAAARLSDAVVESSRMLYMTTAERSFRAAKREHRWEDAARIRLDQAMALFRVAGSPIPPPDDVVQLHREGAAAALHGIGDIAREAELVSATCCEFCQVDDGKSFRIAKELRVARLPHAGCPKGLCRCHWALAVRDRTIMTKYLRKRARAAQRVEHAETVPSA